MLMLGRGPNKLNLLMRKLGLELDLVSGIVLVQHKKGIMEDSHPGAIVMRKHRIEVGLLQNRSHGWRGIGGISIPLKHYDSVATVGCAPERCREIEEYRSSANVITIAIGIQITLGDERQAGHNASSIDCASDVGKVPVLPFDIAVDNLLGDLGDLGD
ncbi:hypothetical protein [Shewanella sp.]|uniref:hypothetical protein n=1 Tax=Shewanella sp. TaxID=50422 RepID=UPI0040481F7C